MALKLLTELWLRKKRIKEWKLINNGILEYGEFIWDKAIGSTIPIHICKKHHKGNKFCVDCLKEVKK